MKKFIIFILILFIFTSCNNEKENEIKKFYNTYKISTGSIDFVESYVWYAEWIIQTKLSTKSSWRIVSLNKEVWDKVTSWELLVSLDSDEAKVWYSTSSNIESMLYDLKFSTSITFDDQIKALEAKIEQSTSSYNWIETWIIDLSINNNNNLESINQEIISAKILLQTAKLDLDKSKNVFITKKEHILKNSISAIINSVILDNNILNYIDNLMWITKLNSDKNDAFQDYLSAKNTSYLSLVKDNFLDVIIDFNKYKNIYEEKIDNTLVNSDNLSEDEIKEILLTWELIQEKIKILLKNTWNVLDNSISSFWYLSENDISNYKKQISNFWVDVESLILSISWDYILWLKWSLENLETFKIEYDKAITLLKQQVSFAEVNLEKVNKKYILAWSSNNSNINEINTKKEVIWWQLNELYATLDALKSSKKVKLQEIDTKIFEVNWNKNSAWVMIDNGKIFSPIDWIVVSKTWEIWEVVWWSFPIYTIWDNSKIKIKLSLSDTVLKNILLWDELDIQFEWNTKKYKGTVTNISQSKDNITKKTPIEIIINNENYEIQIWSMAKVYFPNSQTNIIWYEELNTIIVPNNSIISDFMIPSIYVINSGIVELKKIKILKFWENYSQIEWLIIWDIIITDWKENIFDGEIL